MKKPPTKVSDLSTNFLASSKQVC